MKQIEKDLEMWIDFSRRGQPIFGKEYTKLVTRIKSYGNAFEDLWKRKYGVAQ